MKTFLNLISFLPLLLNTQYTTPDFSSIMVYVIEQETGDTITSDYEMTLFKDQKEVFVKRINSGDFAVIDSLELDHLYQVQVMKKDYLGNIVTVDLRGRKDPVEFIVGVYIIEGCKRIPPPSIPFEFRSADLTNSAKDSLNYMIRVLKENPAIIMSFEIYQFMDESKELTNNRIKAIYQYLKQQNILEKRVENEIVGKEEKWPSSGIVVDNWMILRWDWEE